MELYLLITGVVTLVGVICILVYLEKGSRATAARFKKEREDAQLQLQSLAAIHSLIESSQRQTNAFLSALQSVQEQTAFSLETQEANSAKRAQDATAAQDKKIHELKEKIDELSKSLNNINQNIKAGLEAVVKAECDTAKDLKQAIGDSTKQTQALRQSLEESVKF